MLNEEDSYLILLSIHFEIDQVAVTRDDEFSYIGLRLPTPKVRKFCKHLHGFADGASNGGRGRRITLSQ